MPSREKSHNYFVQSWLVLYNVAMTAGWSIIGVGIVRHFMKNPNYIGLYDQVENLLIIFQTCAIFEIVHAMLGMVRSNVMLTLLQVFSRVGILWGVIIPVKETHDQIGFALLATAWTITEIIRYLFYTFLLIGLTPRILLWLRYTLFIFLYPIGVTGELLTIWCSLEPVRKSGMYSFSLPNPLNFSVDYALVLMGTFPVYALYFPQLYFHMFAQRKKQLRNVAGEAAAKKSN